ncbi:MAG: glycosyl transferase family protein [Alcanivoracaceae bacterium]|nr:glycosyl transferase family protein [Alcanivoracaceae bacterium]
MTEQEHPFAHYVRTLARGKRARRDLTREEAAAAMGMILDGGATDLQTGAFLMSMRVKEETPEELAGFLDASRQRIAPLLPAPLAVDLDWPCYAGKKKHSPWHLLAAWLLACNGRRVMLHGGPEHTPGRLYTDQLLRQRGWPVPTTLAQLEEALQQHGIAYAPLSLFSPALHRLLGLRSELGLRSPINSLTRGLNPAGAPVSLQSIFHPAYLDLHAGAARLCDEHRTVVIKGEGGDPEWRPDASNRVVSIFRGDTCESQVPASLRRVSPTGVAPEQIDQLWQQAETAADDYGTQAVIGTLAVALMAEAGGSDPTAFRQAAEALWQRRDRARLPFQP